MKLISCAFSIILSLILFNCSYEETETVIPVWEPYDESEEIAANADHESRRMRFQLIQSKLYDKNDLWNVIQPQIIDFSESDYESLKPLILDKGIPTIQAYILDGRLTYEELTQWYLYRIAKFENGIETYTNSIISINPNAVEEARQRDKGKRTDNHLIYGMPILLKDNINTRGMRTTAGAHVLINNQPEDAFITNRIKDNGGIILGKTNLSEWANFLCLGCPNGYSAVGGQTLNTYSRKQFDTGGSSSGSGVAIAANYAVAAVGTETSGSILSPSSASSIVGLKPTVGLLSRTGIVPISSTLDTPGPMTKNVMDNAILLSAMSGEDTADPSTLGNDIAARFYLDIYTGRRIDSLRFGVNSSFLDDSLYSETVKSLQDFGAQMVVFDPIEINFEGFVSILTGDMKVDLKHYLENYASDNILVKSVSDVIEFNLLDSTLSIPYGQGRFITIAEETISQEELAKVKVRIENEGRRYFDTHMDTHNLDAILSINNWNAGQAAGAKYPCITLPMGYRDSGQPVGITLIAKPFEEKKLFEMALLFEDILQARKSPQAYQ